MAEAKHTPGPWTVDGPEFHTREYHVFAPDPCEHALADDVYRVAGNLTEGNARLIAAAPEMLEALRVAETKLDAGACYDARAHVRAAIAKATGAQP